MLLRKIFRWMGIAIIALLAVLVAAQTASAQQEDAGRKVKTRVAPVYPELARKMNVSGTVKVQITIEPNGSVKTAKPLGGHPLLIEPSVDAARKWKYEPGKDETTTILQFNFNPAS
ncbi:MAG TPA: energy transducer TonB [Terriglobales bacterium]|nr:energy transducer TonB [Terriglobales bacterium]